MAHAAEGKRGRHRDSKKRRGVKRPTEKGEEVEGGRGVPMRRERKKEWERMPERGVERANEKEIGAGRGWGKEPVQRKMTKRANQGKEEEEAK